MCKMKIDHCTNISLQDAINAVKDAAQAGYDRRVLSGIYLFDEFTQGLFPGELCVIGARPAMGKTGFILSMISNMLNDNIPTGLFTNDNMNVDYLSRIISCINHEPLPHGMIQQIEVLNKAEMKDVPLYLCSSSRLTLSCIKENLTRQVLDYGVKCAFIDSIQSVFNAEPSGNTDEVKNEICKGLKNIAQDLKVPIVVTSLLNSAPKHRSKTNVDWAKPQIHDLPSASVFEDNADSVFLIHRPEYYCILKDEYGCDMRGKTIVVVPKNKNSSIGEFRVEYNSQNGTVYNIGETPQTRQFGLKEFWANETVSQLTEKLDLEILEDSTY